MMRRQFARYHENLRRNIEALEPIRPTPDQSGSELGLHRDERVGPILLR